MIDFAFFSRKAVDIRVDRSGENFPKSIPTMFYGWENASG